MGARAAREQGAETGAMASQLPSESTHQRTATDRAMAVEMQSDPQALRRDRKKQDRRRYLVKI